MTTDALARFSQKMVSITMLLMVAIIMMNAVVLFFPSWSLKSELLGIDLSLSDRLLSTLNIRLEALPWWQAAGAGAISFLVLIPLCYSLFHLRALFCTYARRDYFSAKAAQHMRKIGVSLGGWVMMTIAVEPLLSYWLTMLKPAGEREILFGFELQSISWLFIAVCVIAVAKILEKATLINEENKLFL
ncbi:hypothetical protein SB6411_02199 [Klebsiella spallanzanii]|uniref:DUF2975 domain-containing protein n=2 Tax=Klebsiella spallanzanii TaxID=2587528 RepID=A0A564KAQ3_9ENTR|nr:DUF2975 domain-containing protein [Klebsiella spallanzanii]MDM4206384.1 DUF2975 domain-containing protein [Klebsiella spallanzanii]VUS52318.1 hypothetical protein SB6408_04399 [Klebsiella spallanzanii]VUS67152.1 hypothetical protein SB6411_02199 [Klebsiella spallanzanii]